MYASSTASRLALACNDVSSGLRSTTIWLMLGWQDIKQRYRRSVIGPFWLTLSYGAMVIGMGPLYGQLLKQDIGSYLPYLAVSFVVWILLSGIIVDACNAFIAAEGYIKEVKLPLTVHVMRVVWRNLLIFLHNFVIVLVVALFYPPTLNWTVLLLPLAVLLLAVNGLWVGILFGTLCARFRDIPQVVNSLVQVAFFLTPVMWRPEMLDRQFWITDLNPLYHFLEIVRAPLLSGALHPVSWAAAAGITVAGFAIMLVIFSRFRTRVAYWI